MWGNKVQTKVPVNDVMILWVLLIHQLLISPLCTGAWVGAPGKHAHV